MDAIQRMKIEQAMRGAAGGAMVLARNLLILAGQRNDIEAAERAIDGILISHLCALGTEGQFSPATFGEELVAGVADLPR